MSYKKKKVKKNIINQLKRKIGLIKIVLFKKINKFTKKEVNMQQYQTKIIMQWLRDRSRTIRSNNLRINEWVDKYIDDCILNAKPVQILTQYCLSKDLEKRYGIQGNKFVPLQAEKEMFNKSIPATIEMLKSNNISVNWYITFNNSFLDRGRVSDDIINSYIAMISSLVKNNEILLLNWENDVLGKRPEPNQDVLKNFDNLVSKQAFEIDMKNLLNRVRQYPDFSKTEAELYDEAMYKISCEAEEGRYIFSPEGFFSNGDILITPLEFPERLIFFETITPGFQKRIVPILKLYPWRIDADNLEYSTIK